ncbi:RNA-binding protein 34 isoform X2 [Ornithorhynchus anatinus]|uniref:RNA-binding protein 34 isoform X2 n=1 Tax=Ornithorhynchus anatinus TaxID=9258 RepID=UPI0004546F63|nr:RNA-binding protein 34 isoform X2 [Ornithorhynchus anatinus]
MADERTEEEQQERRPSATGEYRIGQVAGSLPGASGSRGSAGAFALASLFAPTLLQTQALYRPAPAEATRRRKRKEEEESETPTGSAGEPRPPGKRAKKKRRQQPSLADQKLADRESALTCADEEEEERETQATEKRKGEARGPGGKAPARSAGAKPRKPHEGSPEAERLKNERTVFVGNLPVTCNKKIPAEGISTKKLAAIKRKFHPEQKNINAYVVFKKESSAAKALKRNGTQISDGFRIRVDLASETSSRDKRSVFVGNLAYKIEEASVQEHFSDCGQVVAVRIVRDGVTGAGKGFGYVLFANTDAVQLALKLNNSELMGRKLRVMRSVSKEKTRASPNPNRKAFAASKQRFSSLKETGHSEHAFSGEKAIPGKKKKKKKGQKTANRKQAEKHK